MPQLAARAAGGYTGLHAKLHGYVVAGAKAAFFAAGQHLTDDGVVVAMLTRPLGNADAVVHKFGPGLLVAKWFGHGAKCWWG